MKWAWGITTIPERIDSYLPRTFDSLERAGFRKGRFFADGAWDVLPYMRWDMDITSRYPKTGNFTNWVLALGELYYREPEAERYALFDDDIVCVKNLREYLEQPIPVDCYLNLYTATDRDLVIARGHSGWFEGAQRAVGTLGLVFTNEVAETLVGNEELPRDRKEKTIHPRTGLPRGYHNVDGSVGRALFPKGITELLHNPSLVQHIGEVTSMGDQGFKSSPIFPGEDFDAMSLVSAT